ncbi:EAL domain-containing protein [Uliginosibacterium sp. sgz301328]|uniref:EAL domain-containing protein n=1 Tax=Uliginosibacterium sp. sgz301328 TaxID=3243764 RepID=UPI00359E8F77
MVIETSLAARIVDHGVLIVDDSDLQRTHTAYALETLGVTRVAHANDGFVALQRLQTMSPPPAVAIIDLEMPGMDGVELIHSIARLPSHPVLIVSSAREPAIISAVETMVRNLGLPLLGALPKPVTRGALSRMLASFDEAARTTKRDASTQDFGVDAEGLRNALGTGHLRAWFQPKVDLARGRVEGVEALARWLHPDGSVIPPSYFVPLAERSGLMPQLTLTMLDQSIAAMHKWSLAGHGLSVAINLSASAIGDMHLADAIILRAQRANIASERLIFEVTETAMMEDAAAMGTLLRLRLRGFGLSIDDYGTGFSSMQQLSRLPFSEIKIDRSFVTGASARPRLRTILESALDMGRRLGMRTVAEGIETAEDWALANALGCDFAQGYFIARPTPADLLPAAIEELHVRMGLKAQ